MMRGVVFEDFGRPEDVLMIEDVERPSPGDGQVLIKVAASSLNYADYAPFVDTVNGREVAPNLRYAISEVLKWPGKVIGMDVAGVVEEVGAGVTTVKPGDLVFAVTAGMLGGWGEYALANDGDYFFAPENLSFEEAATLPVAASVALGAIRIAGVEEGQSVLVNGASGGIGLLTVQILERMGCIVTGVCSTARMQAVRDAGAQEVIDYTAEDVADRDARYDVILAVNGYETLETYREMLNPGGFYVAVGGSQQTVEAAKSGAEEFKDSGKQVAVTMFPTTPKDFPYLKELAENGTLRPVIDKTYPITQVADAITDIITNRSHGKIALSMQSWS